jgi:hypothetical protein
VTFGCSESRMTYRYRSGYPYRAWLLEVHALYGRLNDRRSPPGGGERLREEAP